MRRELPSTSGVERRSAEPASLRTGETVAIRDVEPSDEPRLREFLDGLCLEARRLRFFTGAVDLEKMAHTVAATGSDRLGLLALDAAGTVVGHALCIELGDGRSEVAVEVSDRLHGAGLGTILVERLAQRAETQGVATFIAQVLPENRAMLDVFRDGFDAQVVFEAGVDRVEFPTSTWRLARERYPQEPPAAGADGHGARETAAHEDTAAKPAAGDDASAAGPQGA